MSEGQDRPSQEHTIKKICIKKYVPGYFWCFRREGTPGTEWETESQITGLGEGSQPVSRWGRGKESDQTRAEKWTLRARQAGKQVFGLLPSHLRVGIALFQPLTGPTYSSKNSGNSPTIIDVKRNNSFLPAFPTVPIIVTIQTRPEPQLRREQPRDPLPWTGL